jgi:hypothetical protein
MEFLTLEDARQRLTGTLVRVNKAPIYIIDVHNADRRRSYELEVQYLSNGKVGTIPYDKNVDLSPVPLGNTNYQGGSYFVSRVPARMWKQGLNENNMHCWDFEGRNVRIPITSKCLIDTIDGKYPLFKEAFEAVYKEKVRSMAFSRDFSIRPNVLVYHSRVEVGNLNGKDIQLFDKFFYLKELLQEAMSNGKE